MIDDKDDKSMQCINTRDGVDDVDDFDNKGDDAVKKELCHQSILLNRKNMFCVR